MNRPAFAQFRQCLQNFLIDFTQLGENGKNSSVFLQGVSGYLVGNFLGIQVDMAKFRDTPVGRFQNVKNIRLTWCEPDWFEYVPSDTDAFAYTTSTGLTIRPGRMFFDGGSTPRFSRLFAKFSPWYYTPVALVHDWLAETQACGRPLVNFNQSVAIQQEALKTMMVENEDWKNVFVFNATRWALKSSKGRRLWNLQEDVCPVPISRKKERLKL